MDVSVITPVGPNHEQILRRAINSVSRQSYPIADHIIVRDAEGKGPSWARNRGLALAKTEFVVFLDADDEIEPEFVRKARRVIQPGRYVYTDWLQNDADGVIRKYVAPEPDNVWCLDQSRGKFHIITTLMHTDDARRAGGFNESMRTGGEDKEFWYRMKHEAGICGIVIHEPLAWYHADAGNTRSHDYANRDAERVALDVILTKRYGGKPMACCGGSKRVSVFSSEFSGPQTFEWERAPRNKTTMVCDTLVEYKCRGNRTIVGRVTGFTYPRGSFPKQIYIDARDAMAAPHDWRIVVSHPEPMAATGMEVLAAIIDGTYVDEPEPEPAAVKPPRKRKPRDIKKTTEIAKRAADES